MRKSFVEINLSKQKYNRDGANIVRFKLDKEEEESNILEMNFTQLFVQSRYLREKYKYSEAQEIISTEMEYFCQQHDIKIESIEFFNEMLENEYVTLPIENYDDIFKLSEYFDISKIKQELESIEEEELFNDFEFTLQRIIAKHKDKDKDKNRNRNDDSWKLSKKEEEFLTTRINECLKHPLFMELPTSIVYRAVAGNPKEKIDFNSVLDFILNSKENAFIILNLIEIHCLSEEKISDLLEFICEQEEETQRIYSQYIPFDRIYIERILEDKKELQRELGETKTALDMTNRSNEQINDELEHTKTRLAEKENEVKQLNEYLIGSKKENQRLREELEMKNKENNELRDELTIRNEEMKSKRTEIQQVNTSLLQIIDENNRMKATIERTTNEFTKIQQELKQVKEELSQIQVVKVCGYDPYSARVDEPNNKNFDNYPCIHPSMNLHIELSSLLSYSPFSTCSVQIFRSGSMKGRGYNKDCSICSSLPRQILKESTEFSIKDGDGRHLTPISSVCICDGTLYMLSNPETDEIRLVLCHAKLKDQQVFLDIGDEKPVALFGGCENASAISSNGGVIFINPSAVQKSFKSRIVATSLPCGEKAVSVACCTKSLFVLSSRGQVYSSPVETGNNAVHFSKVSELSNQEITCITGIYEHCLATSEEGIVFCRGSNSHGQLGIGKGTKEVSEFIQISSLEGYKIRSAYAGKFHSLFETQEGKIFSCGSNYNGQLFLNTGPSEARVYTPTETTIKYGARFCIASSGFSVIFIGIELPPNTPNRKIDKNQLH